MITLGGFDPFASPQAQQVVFAHQPKRSLVVDLPAFSFEQSGDVTIPALAVLEGQLLQPVADRHLFITGLFGFPTPVVTGAADPGQLAHFHQTEHALHLHLLLDYFEDAVPPLPFFGWRDAST